MTERSYTVRELDDLRDVVRTKLLWGTYDVGVIPNNAISHAQVSQADIEAAVRTHMFAGHTAEDLLGRKVWHWGDPVT